ncbi:MAG: hypothetical protein D6706_12095 [Chloroflexi bacterium]|nr:MAG: hypothetical protein D6706_12095 [Chloroflexota bacterium]
MKLKLPQNITMIFRNRTVQAVLFFAVTTGLMLYPILFHFFDKLPVSGDSAEYLWKLWWFKHSLLTGQSPWVVPDIFYPHGYRLAYGEISPANTIFALPLTLLLNEVAVYNLLVLFSTLLSGLGMFLLARQISGSFGAGILAGVIFAFAPFRFIQFIHLPIFPTQWWPFMFLSLEQFACSRKPQLGLAAGIFFALNALTSWYYAVAGVLFVFVWAVIRFVPWSDYLRDKRSWLAAGLFAGAALSLITPFIWPYLTFAGETQFVIPLQNSNYYSASLTDYILPSPVQFLWGHWVRTNLLNRPEPGEFILGWGVMAWLFGIYALRWGRRQQVRPWLAVVTVALVLSFGLTLHLAGRQIVIPAPQSVVAVFNKTLNTIAQHYSLVHEPFTLGQANGVVIPLPALFLRWFVPIIGKLRTWTRFGVIALLGVSVLAALGSAAWERRELKVGPLSTKRQIAWAVVIGLTLFELWWQTPSMHAPPSPRLVDTWLAAQPGQFVIMEYPLDSAFSPKQMWYTRIHKKKIVYGYTTFLSFLFSYQYPEMVDFPNPEAISRLAEWQVRYLLVETAPPYDKTAKTILFNIRRFPCLQQRTVQGTVYVFELKECK